MKAFIKVLWNINRAYFCSMSDREDFPVQTEHESNSVTNYQPGTEESGIGRRLGHLKARLVQCSKARSKGSPNTGHALLCSRYWICWIDRDKQARNS